MTSEILIVEGDSTKLGRLQDILQTVGYNVTVANSAQQALAVVNPTTHKLVFINLMLPDLGGIDLLREIRPIVPNARAVLLTETEDVIAQQEAKGLGVHKWLFFPVRPDEVIRCAAEVLEQASLAEENKTETGKRMVRSDSAALKKGPHR